MGKISMHELANYAVDQLESGMQTSDVAEKLAAYLLEERRSREMPALMRAIEAELNGRGSTQVTITAAHITTEDTKKQLAELLGADNPTFHEVIDSSVIAGVKARSGESEIDLTVRTKLNKFKSSIVNQG